MSRSARLLALLALLAPLAFLSSRAFAAPVESMCRESSVTGQPPAVADAEPIRVTADISKTPLIDIGRENRSGDVEIRFRSDKPLPPGALYFEAGRFSRGSQRLDPKTITVTTDRRNAAEVVVDVCVDRKLAHVRPGAYTGSVIVRDTRLTGSDIPISLNMQDSRLNWLGGTGWVLATLLAVLGVWVTLRRAAGKPTFGKGAWVALKAWSNVNLIFIVAVAGAASFGAFQVQGLSNGEFAGDFMDYVGLFAAMFGAAYTAGNLPPAIAGQKTDAP